MHPVVVTRRAAREIAEAADWWSTNRSNAPALFRMEIARAFQLVSARPEIGASAIDARLAGVRRVLLSRIRYHLYYRVASDTVEILALWHTSRAAGPDV